LPDNILQHLEIQFSIVKVAFETIREEMTLAESSKKYDMDPSQIGT